MCSYIDIHRYIDMHRCVCVPSSLPMRRCNSTSSRFIYMFIIISIEIDMCVYIDI